MELVTKRIPLPSTVHNEVLIMPVGDIQFLSEDGPTALKMLQRHIKWGVEHKAYFLGMGDYIDALSPSNRQKLAQVGMYETVEDWLDMAVEKHMLKPLYETALAPSKGRWLGLLHGHHYYQFKTGVLSDQKLAEWLDAPFLGTSAYVRLVFTYGTSTGTILIWCHHGVGSGLRTAAPLNRLELVTVHWEADIYLMGHQTRKVGAPIDRCEPYWPRRGAPKVIHRTKIIACTGGFMKGYREFAKQGNVPMGNYIEQKMLNPVALGGVLIRIRPRWVPVTRPLAEELEISFKSGANHKVWLPDISIEQ